MTISTTITKHVYEGNGSTMLWDFTFKINQASDISVYIVDSDGNISDALESGYDVDTSNKRVQYPGDGSGLDVLADGEKIVLAREVPYTQETTLTRTGPFDKSVVEQQFDKQTMISQQLKEALNRCVKYPIDQSPDQADTEQFLSDVQAARDAAEASASAAATSESNAADSESNAADSESAASSAKDDAETAQAAAESAKSAAEAAQGAAESAQTAASNSASAAQGYANTATTKANEASTSESNALTYKNDAESAKSDAEAAQSAAEDAQEAAETAQAAAEAAQAVLENWLAGTPFSMANNKATPQDVTDLLLDKNTYRSVKMEFQMRLTDDGPTELFGLVEVFFYYNTGANSWYASIGQRHFDNTGVGLSITAAGQVRYTSPNLTGGNELLELSYRALSFGV